MGRSLIDTASYDPDTLKILSQAFDEVWQEIAGKYYAEAMIEDRRNRLATIILGLADGGERDLSRMKTCTSKLMAHALQATSPKPGQAPRRLTHRTMSGLRV
jgi:hypothetical protein